MNQNSFDRAVLVLLLIVSMMIASALAFDGSDLSPANLAIVENETVDLPPKFDFPVVITDEDAAIAAATAWLTEWQTKETRGRTLEALSVENLGVDGLIAYLESHGAVDPNPAAFVSNPDQLIYGGIWKVEMVGEFHALHGPPTTIGQEPAPAPKVYTQAVVLIDARDRRSFSVSLRR